MRRPAILFASVAAVLALQGSASAVTVVTCLSVPATIVGTDAGETINGTPGDDVIVAFGGADQVNGGDGDDLICGGDGNDILNGGNDHDQLSGEADDDQLIGDEGVDLALYVDSQNPVTVNLTTALATGWGSDLVQTEGAVGSFFADHLIGNDEFNYFDGGLGNDVLEGRGGPDVLDGSPGNDRMRGGPGADLVDFTFAPRKIVLNLGTRRAKGWGTDTIIGVEDAIGSDFSDSLTGNGNANQFFGGLGNDILSGRGGPDRLFGEQGADWLYGGPGRDRLNGGAGSDHGDGGPDPDVCVGLEFAAC